MERAFKEGTYCHDIIILLVMINTTFSLCHSLGIYQRNAHQLIRRNLQQIKPAMSASEYKLCCHWAVSCKNLSMVQSPIFRRRSLCKPSNEANVFQYFRYCRKNCGLSQWHLVNVPCDSALRQYT